jgi:hypothetical protein
MKNRLRSLRLLIAFSLLFTACSSESEHAASAEFDLGDDSVATILEILEMPDRLDRTDRLVAALRAVPGDQTDVLESVMTDLKTPFREFERILIVSAYAKSDPKAATKWVMRKTVHELLRATMLNETVYEWARTDPESLRTDFKVAMAALRGWDATMLRALVRGWYDSGQPELEDFIRGLRHGDDQQRAISELSKNRVAKEGPRASIAWVTALRGDLKYRAYAYSRLAADIAKVDPQAAIEWCDEICDTEVGKDLPHWISSSWVREGGVDAMDWVMGRTSASDETSSALVGVRSSFRRFQMGFPEESDAWVEAFPEEDRLQPRFQGPIILYVGRQASRNRPEVAIEWARFIKNDWERSRALRKIGTHWLRHDQEAAEVWLAEMTGLDDISKRNLQDNFRNYKAKAEKTRKSLEMKPDWVIDLDEKG